ncbi:hypothetical protein CBF36_11250 [Vagococcus bubulae]|uniref:UmuC domain-containing protein n=1 Tax=Vagococcus bubulae TaxID=1977868 RepID=A0A429ZAI3_9ENTE|nr:hypothetical protein CBF36_11250 [Vagococcus bubulae]
MVMQFGVNPTFDYSKEPSRDILCIDCKSFYGSVECVERGLNPLQAKLAFHFQSHPLAIGQCQSWT